MLPLAALMLILAAVACGRLGFQVQQQQQPAWTPAPITPSAVAVPMAVATSVTPAPSPEMVATGEPFIPLATEVPTAEALATATPDQHHVVISETDIANVIAGGALENAGVHTENLRVRFTGGKTWITADRVTYSLIDVQNLTIVGRLVAQNGKLQLETESVSPQGLVTAMIPGLINQAFSQYTSQWYVENVQTYEGRIELQVR